MKAGAEKYALEEAQRAEKRVRVGFASLFESCTCNLLHQG